LIQAFQEKTGGRINMTKKLCLCFAVAAMVSLAAVSDASAFFGSRGSSGSCGSSGGSWGGWGGWGSGGSNGSSGGWGSNGSHGGGLLHRIFHGGHGSNGSNGSCGSSGGSYGSSGGSAYSYGGGEYYVTARPAVTTAPVMVAAQSPAPVVKTELTLQVPADAKVTLAGVPTKQTGEIRHFTTTKLASGQAWQNYQIVVEMARDGQVVREERKITLTGGQPISLAIATVNTTTLAQATR
jgi:uncharacterized protein (TIGR03000 family)